MTRLQVDNLQVSQLFQSVKDSLLQLSDVVIVEQPVSNEGIIQMNRKVPEKATKCYIALQISYSGLLNISNLF